MAEDDGGGEGRAREGGEWGGVGEEGGAAKEAWEMGVGGGEEEAAKAAAIAAAAMDDRG